MTPIAIKAKNNLLSSAHGLVESLEQSTGMVAGNWARARSDYSMVCNHLSLEAGTLLPRLGNPKLEYRVGMVVALATVCTSLREGRNSSNIQVDTMRRTQTWYGNAHDAGSGYSCQTVVGPTSHTFERWFSRFMRGLD